MSAAGLSPEVDTQPQPLSSCPNASVPCSTEAIMSALSYLRALVQPQCSACQTWVYSPLNATAQRTIIDQAGFSSFVARTPRFWDGTRSFVSADVGFCPGGFLRRLFECDFSSSWTVSDWITGKVKVAGNYLPPNDALSQTPADDGKGMQIFFNPKTAICNVVSIQNPLPGDQGVLNQAVLFHEALHGYTGKMDPYLEGSFGLPTLPAPSVNITYYIEGTYPGKTTNIIPGGAQGDAQCTNQN
jgi:hypothetical protein